MVAVAGSLFAALAALGAYYLREKPIVLVILLAIAGVPLAMGAPGTALITTTIALAILLAQPLYVLLGAITLLCFRYLAEVPPLDYGIFPEKMFELTDKAVLLAIPFFVVAGAIMTHGGIAKRLVNFAQALTAWLPGGMAIAAIGGCVLFAAISGSSPVTVIAIGGMMYPALVSNGYDERESIGLLTSAGSLGIVIPPSIPMIIYAIVVSAQQVVDVGDLFLAGIGPGLLIGGMLAAFCVGRALQRSENLTADLTRLGIGFTVVVAPFVIGYFIGQAGTKIGYLLGPATLFVLSAIIARKEFLEGFWALMLPVIILGGIYSGLFTPTEAAAVAVVYSLVVAIYIYDEMGWKDLPELLADSTVMMGSLVVIMVIAFVFNDYLVEESIPQMAVELIKEMELSRFGFLIALNIFLLLVGCFMDIISAILIIAPLIVPMAMAPGIDIDPIHLGIVFIVNLAIGYLTPPLGLNLFVSSTLFKKPIGEVVRSIIPYTVMMLIGIVMITYIPSIALGPGQLLAELYGTKEEPKGEILSIQDLMKQADADEEDEDEDDDWDDEDDFEDEAGVDAEPSDASPSDASPSDASPSDAAAEPSPAEVSPDANAPPDGGAAE